MTTRKRLENNLNGMHIATTLMTLLIIYLLSLLLPFTYPPPPPPSLFNSHKLLLHFIKMFRFYSYRQLTLGRWVGRMLDL